MPSPQDHQAHRWTTALCARAVTPGTVTVLLATAFLIAHLSFLPPTPTGVDAVNFALGVRDFNVAEHRPHAPGYPVFIALGKTTRTVLERFPAGSAAELMRSETFALAMWSAVFGAIAVFSLRLLFRAIEPDDRRAVAAAALTIACPLFWFNANRPMSDISGLSAALAAQALTMTAFRRNREAMPGARTRLILGAFVAGLAMGFRSQATWLTLPLLAFVTIDHARRARDRSWVYVAAAVVTGILLWAIPLVVASGGPTRYVAALTGQAGDDLSSGTMLVTAPGFKAAALALVRMVAYPWADKYLAVLIVSLAAIGCIRMIMTARLAFGLLALSFGPYVIYHLMFQDAAFLRYVLPVLPALAYLSVRGLEAISSRMTMGFAAALTVACLYVAIPPAASYAETGSPSLRAVDAMRNQLLRAERRPVLAMHHAVSRVLRLEDLPAPTIPAPPKHEWLELVKYWNTGAEAPVWFLAEPERTDLTLIDPTSRRLVGSYRLPFDRRFFMSGVRPSGVDWYEIDSPGWFAADGWALMPETAGVASEDARGPDRAPIIAYVRRRPDAAVVMVGGRHLDPGGQPARFDLSIDDRPIESWVVGSDPGFFLRTLQLPAGALRSPQTGERYSRLQIRSAAADGSGARVRTSIEQFDLQSADRVVFGFGDGWYEQEYAPDALRLWRWASPKAVLRIHHGGHDLAVCVTGQAPAGQLGGAVTMTVRAGNQVFGRVTVSRDFALRAQVPTGALDRSDGLLTIETDRGFVPDATLGNGDRRLLALRVSGLRIDAATVEQPQCGK